MVWNPKYTLTKEIISDLTRIEAVKNSFENRPLSPVLLSSLHQSAKISSTHYSTRIEGNHLSLNEVEKTLHTLNKSVQGYQAHDEKEVKAYYNAITYMEKYLAENHKFCESFIQKIHALVEGQKKTTPYRDAQNAVYDSSNGSLVYLPPETQDVPGLMKDLVTWINENGDILPVPVLAGLFHYQFVTIHPYFDGNGRTARLCTSFLMRKFGYGLKGIYSLEEYYATNLIQYYQALKIHPHHNYYFGRAQADLTPWLAYFIKGIALAFENIETKARQAPHNSVTVDKTPVLRKLDIKQRKILELFTQFEQITSKQAGQYLSLTSQSARMLLNSWIQKGFLKVANPAKKNRTYALTDEFETLLEE